MRKKLRSVLLKPFKDYFQEIIAADSTILRLSEYLQHGTTTRLLHSVAVAYYSYRFALFIGLTLHLGEIIRASLVHDYYLYNSKEHLPEHKGHGKMHPQIALSNAQKGFILTDMERDIISNHMFPVTPTKPQYRESAIVCMIDKACAVYEFFIRKTPYPFLNAYVVRDFYSGKRYRKFIKEIV